ncbi:MAG: xanthine dehydrogenase family protein molybdopterin-binding subunit [Pseudomonadota bacterium]|jgi:Aerobic-type carbon monoxide dehydrogenase, large subunit CoxL/CutL homologs|nr:MAG: twin-arginine translocation pathway signal protein [Pseudomonadota bacterium]
MNLRRVEGIVNVSRRDVLRGGTALTLSVALLPALPGCADASRGGAAAPFEPNAFVRITDDGIVTVISKHVELGQGAHTGLATLVAEELDADWSQIRVEDAPADAQRYANLAFRLQGTGGSTSLANSYEQFRTAGATARAMLVAAAANRWGVAADEITVTAGRIEHAPSGRSAGFGELVAEAAQLPVPGEVRLKDPADFRLIGRPVTRVDARAKSTGTAIFTQDVRLPGMLTAVVAHPPRFGATVKSFDAIAAKAVKGVHDVVAFETPVHRGVAVIARDFWSARKGRDALKVEWDETNAFKRSSADLLAEYRALSAKPGTPVRREGDADAALARAARRLEAIYEFPFLAHAPMEPLNCVVRLGDGECEIWNGDQLQTGDQAALGKLLGIPPEKVKINTVYAGGSFGRRGNAHSDYVVEAAAIAKAAGLTVPLKLVWTREDDMRAGFYRPMYVHRIEAGLDRAGRIVAWRHRIVGQSLVAGTLFAPLIRDGVDPTSVEGVSNLPYAVPNLSVDLHTTELPVTVQFWRAVGSTHTAFAVECFIDEIARATGADPYTLRRELLAAHPRHVAVLDAVAERSAWRAARDRNRILGLAIHESFGSVVAQVAQLARTDAGVTLEKVFCVVDCGLAVNPNVVAMQMESGIGYGLSAALSGAITLRDGIVEQSNFDDYPVVRIDQMPDIDVHIMPSTNRPSGVGEPATPVIAPALANALAAANGRPVRALPLAAQGITLT